MNIFEFYEFLFPDKAPINTEKINNAVNNWIKFSEKIVEGYIAFNNWWQNVYPKIHEAIVNLNIPEYAVENKRELIRCYEKWGEYAWTFNGQTGITAFCEYPDSKEKADEEMKQYCTLNNVIEISDKLVEKGVSKEDLEEALFCFENGKYKSSALILFALIDHELIEKKIIKKSSKKEWYASGNSAVKELKNQNEKDYDKSFLYANLCFLNIMKTLATLFAGGDNFANEPNLINRNYITHGMSERKVTELDCFRVWSALYSLVVLLPVLEEVKNDYNRKTI